MKSVIRFNIILAFVIAVFSSSCKNNKDGYSDEIETIQLPADSNKVKEDSVAAKDLPAKGAEAGTSATGKIDAAGLNRGNEAERKEKRDNPKGTGTAIGPGESPKDGATYTNSDSTKNSKLPKK